MFTMADALAVPSHFMEATASRHVQAPVVVAQPTVDPALFAPPALDASGAAHAEYCRAAAGKGVGQMLIGESESPDLFRKGEASRCPWMDLERRRPVACACGRRPHWSHDARQGTRVAGSGCRGGVPGPWPRPGPVPCVWVLSVAEVCVVCAVCGVWCVVSAKRCWVDGVVRWMQWDSLQLLPPCVPRSKLLHMSSPYALPVCVGAVSRFAALVEQVAHEGGCTHVGCAHLVRAYLRSPVVLRSLLDVRAHSVLPATPGRVQSARPRASPRHAQHSAVHRRGRVPRYRQRNVWHWQHRDDGLRGAGALLAGCQ
jgi:hypothetical protein